MKIQNYKKTDPAVWKGRVDDPNDPNAFRWHQVIQLLDLSDTPSGEPPITAVKKGKAAACFALLGFCCDEGVRRNQGRVGAAEGPAAIRKALVNLPVHFGDEKIIYDAGDVLCRAQDLEGAQAALSQAIYFLLSHHIVPIVLGGGHEVALGHGRALMDWLAGSEEPASLGIINFDAHFDIRPLEKGKGSSGTPFLQLADYARKKDRAFKYLCLGIERSANTRALFQKADALGAGFVLCEDIRALGFEKYGAHVDRFLASVDRIYLTVCLDVFAEAFAPGVSAPVAGGLYPNEFFPLFSHIVRSKKVIGFDIAEMAPPYDRDEQTARLAARIIFEFLR